MPLSSVSFFVAKMSGTIAECRYAERRFAECRGAFNEPASQLLHMHMCRGRLMPFLDLKSDRQF